MIATDHILILIFYYWMHELRKRYKFMNQVMFVSPSKNDEPE